MSSSPGDFARLRELFERAVDLPIELRRAFVATECDGNPGLRRQLEAMLDEDAVQGSLLDGNAASLAGGILRSLDTRQCGPYLLEALLGEGGMGVVYRGRRADLGSLAAIKLLRDAWVSPSRRERFEREQRTLAQLHHPGIATLLDAGVTPDGTPWIAMQLVEGEQLLAYCRSRSLNVNARLRLFLHVCDAVQYAHERAIIHRDLKPSNILVDASGTPKLLDFGIAKRIEDTQLPADATRTEFRMMTPKYAAPEQVRGEAAGVFTDVFALGVVLAELIDGAPGPAAWDELSVITQTAAHPDVAARYRGAGALADDVRRYLAGEPLQARPDTRYYRLRKLLARHRAGIAALAAGLLIAASLAAYFTWRLKQSRDEALAAATRAERIQSFLLQLFEGGDKAAGPAHGLTVEALIDRGLREAPALDREPAVQAEVYDTLGRMYGRLGRYDAAERLLRSAIRRNPGTPQEIESRIELALQLSEQGRLEEAEAIARRTIAQAPAHLAAQETLGRILTERGQYDEAVRTLAPVVAKLDQLPELDKRAAAVSALASAHFYAGHYDQSRTLNERALALRTQAHGERHPFVASDWTNLGAIEFDTGRYAQAEPHFRRALAIMQAWYGPEHPETGSALTMLGRALVYQQRNDEARPLLQKALAIQEKTFGPAHARVASVLNDLGNIDVAAARYDEAETCYRRMEEIYRQTRGDAHYLVATALSNRANVYLKKGEYARSETIMRDVVARYTKALSPSHTNTAIARIRLGRALSRQKRWREALVESQAGYDLLSAQAQPAVSWLQGAREDLAAGYAALGKAELAARFRQEWDEARK